MGKKNVRRTGKWEKKNAANCHLPALKGRTNSAPGNARCVQDTGYDSGCWI